MRILWLWMVSLALGFGGTVPEMLVLTGDRDAKSVRIASLKLQLAQEEDEALASLFDRYRVTLTVRSFGKMHALVVEPIRSLAARNALVMALGQRYPELFFVNQSSAVTLPNKVQAPKTQAPVSADAHAGMQPLDWVWTAIFFLSFFGLVSSIYQRKRMQRLSREQTSLQADQERMDGAIETLQGEKNG